MARDATGTRQKLLDAALRLWATHGVEGVTLTQIQEAAGQRNASALHYHFKSRDGLLAAVFDRHVPGIRARRQELLDEALASTALRPVAAALVLPVGELIGGGWRDRAFVRVAADLLSGTSRAELTWLIGDSAVVDATELFRARAAIPAPVESMRLQVAGSMVVHTVADYARRHETRGRKRVHDPELFLENLVDMWIGAMTAPVSAATESLIAGAEVGAVQGR